MLIDGLIYVNPTDGIKGFSLPESEREFLSFEEVQLLAKTECSREGIKTAFLFSCLTGIRHCDISALKWHNIDQQKGYIRIVFTQKKTKGLEYLDISPYAASLLGERKEPDDFVFDFQQENHTISRVVREWVAAAGIEKDITFHCARHTFAVMMLDLGTDIYMVSKLLGHRNINTTQIYAKILDKNKQSAVNRIPDIFRPKDKAEGQEGESPS